jgi:hypothetical protein
MVQLPDDDPRMQQTLHKLQLRLNTIWSGVINQSVIDHMNGIVMDLRSEFKRDYGYEFPRLCLFLLPSIPLITFFLADLTVEEIQQKMLVLIKNLQTAGYSINAAELAQAIITAWPHYKPEVDRHLVQISHKVQ